MNTEETSTGGYGYASDEIKQNPFNFGLNHGVTKMTQFKFIMNGGKEGAEQEALEITFEINGTVKNYRKFPFVQGYDKNNNPVTDPNAKEFKEGLQDFNANISHILHAFVDDMTIKQAFSKRISSFKEYCQIAANILPKDFDKRVLDVFMQYQYTLKDGQPKTYLDLPNNLKQGKWISPTRPGPFKEIRVENPSDTTREALVYENNEGRKHDFVRRGWFMNSNYAKQQFAAEESGQEGTTTDNSSAGEAQNLPSAGSGTKPAAW